MKKHLSFQNIVLWSYLFVLLILWSSLAMSVFGPLQSDFRSPTTFSQHWTMFFAAFVIAGPWLIFLRLDIWVKLGYVLNFLMLSGLQTTAYMFKGDLFSSLSLGVCLGVLMNGALLLGRRTKLGLAMCVFALLPLVLAMEFVKSPGRFVGVELNKAVFFEGEDIEFRFKGFFFPGRYHLYANKVDDDFVPSYKTSPWPFVENLLHENRGLYYKSERNFREERKHVLSRRHSLSFSLGWKSSHRIGGRAGEFCGGGDNCWGSPSLTPGRYEMEVYFPHPFRSENSIAFKAGIFDVKAPPFEKEGFSNE
jgi:hypothetical protein